MRDTLTVSINRNETHAIDVAPVFETAGSFVIRLENSGAPAHVHLHLDDELSTVATLEANNHYVKRVREVTVNVVESERPISGKLKLVTGYGANREFVDIELVEPIRGKHYVDVDEGLSEPRQRDVEPESSWPFDGVTPLAVLAGFALVLAILAVSLTESAIVLVGVGAVIIGIVVGFLFIR